MNLKTDISIYPSFFGPACIACDHSSLIQNRVLFRDQIPDKIFELFRDLNLRSQIKVDPA